MHDEIGVAADRRGEMRVLRLGEAVMAERLHGVTRAHERAQEADLQRGANRQRAELAEQFLHLRAVIEVSAGHAMAQHVLTDSR
jgi:hypothetical protein